jgi:hypothetical protein
MMTRRLAKIERPSSKRWNPVRRVAVLRFPSGYEGEFYMRGGICWPTPIEELGSVGYQGAAILGGQDIETGVCYVFEEFEFTTALVSSTAPGLDSFLAANWELYFAQKYFHGGDFNVARRFIAPIERCRRKYANRKLSFHFPHVAVDFDRDYGMIWEYIARESLYFPRGKVHAALAELKSGATPIKSNVFAMALAAFVFGVDLVPWKEIY